MRHGRISLHSAQPGGQADLRGDGGEFARAGDPAPGRGRAFSDRCGGAEHLGGGGIEPLAHGFLAIGVADADHAVHAPARHAARRRPDPAARHGPGRGRDERRPRAEHRPADPRRHRRRQEPGGGAGGARQAVSAGVRQHGARRRGQRHAARGARAHRRDARARAEDARQADVGAALPLAAGGDGDRRAAGHHAVRGAALQIDAGRFGRQAAAIGGDRDRRVRLAQRLCDRARHRYRGFRPRHRVPAPAAAACAACSTGSACACPSSATSSAWT